MKIFSKREGITFLFLFFVLLEVLFFFYDVLHAFSFESQKHIRRLIESKKNATMSMAIMAVDLLDAANLSDARLRRLSLDLQAHTKFKNIWFKIVDNNGVITDASIPVSNRYFYKDLPWKLRYFSDFIIDCKGIHIASFAPFQYGERSGFFGVISQFNSIQHELEKEGVDSITVVDRRFAKEAFGIYQAIDGYKVVNLKPNPHFLELLAAMDLTKLFDRDFLVYDGTLIGRYPLRRLDGEIVGWIIYAKPLKTLIFDIFYKKIFVYVGLFFILLLWFIYLLVRISYKEQREIGEYYKKIFERLGEIVFITNGERILYANAKFYEYFDPETKCICDYFVADEGFLDKREWKRFLRSQSEGKAKIQRGNQEFVFLIRTTQVAPNQYSVIMVDVTQQYYYEKSLEIKALKDPLTGLYNRYMLIQTFIRLKEESQLEGSELVLVLFDIDHFKKINDTYGHDKGDLILKRLAKILREFFRSEDMLFRIGGEEFLLLLKTKDTQKILSNLQRLKEHVAQTDFDGVRLTISMGVAIWCGESFERLFKRVDEALYHSKRTGRNKITFDGDCDG